jgi:hypothetical protein
MLSPDINEILEFAEANAQADLIKALPVDLAAELGMQFQRIGSATAFAATRVNIVMFNRVIGLGIRESLTQPVVDSAVEYMRQHAASKFAFQIIPSIECPELPDWLAAHHLYPSDHWAKFYRGASPPPEIRTDLRVERVSQAQAAEFAAVFCTGYGVPDSFRPMIEAPVGRANWFHYFAYNGDVPAATGILFVDQGVGWLGYDSTLPAQRRRGAQSAIIARRIRDGIELGCRWFVVETGNSTPEHPNRSYMNMLRSGFQLAYLRASYERTG